MIVSRNSYAPFTVRFLSIGLITPGRPFASKKMHRIYRPIKTTISVRFMSSIQVILSKVFAAILGKISFYER
jgi:hypothetical protein